jgi:DNA-binding MarR family transcriptional regulator
MVSVASLKIMWLHDLKKCISVTMDLNDEIASTCFGNQARRATRAVTRVFDARMRAIDLKITQFAVLLTISSHPELAIAGIAKKLDLEPSALQRNVAVLQKCGFVEGDGKRGRSGQRFRLTALGAAKLKEAIPIWRKVHLEIAHALAGEADLTLRALKHLEQTALNIERHTK